MSVVTATFTNNENDKKAVVTITDMKIIRLEFTPEVKTQNEAEEYAACAAFFVKSLAGANENQEEE